MSLLLFRIRRRRRHRCRCCRRRRRRFLPVNNRGWVTVLMSVRLCGGLSSGIASEEGRNKAENTASALYSLLSLYVPLSLCLFFPFAYPISGVVVVPHRVEQRLRRDCG